MDRSRTKLVCTIGPATSDRISELVAAGMDVARINFSHGTAEDHRAYTHAVRSAAHSARRSVAVMADLPGPKIRLGRLRDDAVTLETGTTFVLRQARKASVQPDESATETIGTGSAEQATRGGSADEVQTEDTPPDAASTSATADAPSNAPNEVTPEAAPEPTPGPPLESNSEPTPVAAGPEQLAVDTADELGDADGATVSEAALASRLQVGDRVLLGDGAAELRVIKIGESDVTTTVVNGGTIRSRSGVNVPSERLIHVGLTDADRAAVPRALELRVDLIAQSFVRSADDVKALRALLPNDGPRIVAKIETRAAVDSFEGIVAVADGIMVARGDLGVDLPFEDVPLIQKDLIRRATAADRFSIVATQMLESMTTAPRPTRAEASDVANAVLDGTDAVMLSAETAIGAFPVDALKAMSRICTTTEANWHHHADHTADAPPESASDSIITAARFIADGGGLARETAIWCFTRSGRTAELLSLQRPGIPIVAFTLNPIVARRLAVRSAVVPMVLSGSGPRGEPLLERMSAAWRAQRNRTDFATIILVTTSRQPAGINRLEVHSLAQPTNSKAPSPTH